MGPIRTKSFALPRWRNICYSSAMERRRPESRMTTKTLLVLGGARSGKSRYA